MSFRAVPESTSYRDPASGEFFQRQGTVSGSGRYEPIQTMEIRYDRDLPFRSETLPYIPGRDDKGSSPLMNLFSSAVDKAQKWKEFSAGSEDYSQSGTDIPSFSTGSGGAFAAGSDFPGQGFGYQYQSPSAVAQGIPVGQDPRFPMSQEDFSEIVNQNLDSRVRQPIMLSPELQQRIRATRSRLGIGPI
jgi:hypothetical protein